MRHLLDFLWQEWKGLQSQIESLNADRRQQPDLCSLTADPRSGATHIDCGGLGDRERRGFQERARVCGLALTSATAMVNRRKGKVAGHQSTGKSVSAQDVHSWSAGCCAPCETRRLQPEEVDERDRNQNCTNVVIVATANKLARISWAVLASGENYHPTHKALVFSN